jgi:hypothetical protein
MSVTASRELVGRILRGPMIKITQIQHRETAEWLERCATKSPRLHQRDAFSLLLPTFAYLFRK